MYQARGSRVARDVAIQISIAPFGERFGGLDYLRYSLD